MGRRTFDMVETFQEWPYGTTPVLVATSQHLASPRASVRAANGTIEEVVDQAKRAAGSRDVYLDGGALIRSALDARLIDEITVTLVPIVLGQGLPLFAGATRACPLQLLGSRNIGGGLVELKYDFAEERI